MRPCFFAAARQSFKEHEALVYTQLAQLIKDGVWLKSYIAAVMRVEQTVRPVYSFDMQNLKGGIGDLEHTAFASSVACRTVAANANEVILLCRGLYELVLMLMPRKSTKNAMQRCLPRQPVQVCQWLTNLGGAA